MANSKRLDLKLSEFLARQSLAKMAFSAKAGSRKAFRHGWSRALPYAVTEISLRPQTVYERIKNEWLIFITIIPRTSRSFKRKRSQSSVMARRDTRMP